jgi:DNA-binding Lrp family transcriptional regulator
MRAMLLINVEPGKDKKVIEQLEKTEGIKEAYIVYGRHDIIAKVEAENLKRIREIISNRVRQLDAVDSVVPLVAV